MTAPNIWEMEMFRTDLQDPLCEERLLLNALGALDKALSMAQADEDKAMALCGVAYGYMQLAGAANYEDDNMDEDVKVTVNNNV